MAALPTHVLESRPLHTAHRECLLCCAERLLWSACLLSCCCCFPHGASALQRRTRLCIAHCNQRRFVTAAVPTCRLNARPQIATLSGATPPTSPHTQNCFAGAQWPPQRAYPRPRWLYLWALRAQACAPLGRKRVCLLRVQINTIQQLCSPDMPTSMHLGCRSHLLCLTHTSSCFHASRPGTHPYTSLTATLVLPTHSRTLELAQTHNELRLCASAYPCR